MYEIQSIKKRGATLKAYETIGFVNTSFKCVRCGKTFYGNGFKPLDNIYCSGCKEVRV